ncbi:chemotaxis protein CheX [bacterium]|nr:chemotaxis protein CheX [bacterium]
MGKINDVSFFKPFVLGAIQTLKVQCSTEVKGLKPFYKGEKEQPPFDIASIISLQSNAFVGTITLCYPANVFLHIMSKMLGEEFTEITEDLEDGASELLNIIFGQAKRVLTNEGYVIEKAIPTIIRGKDLRTRSQTKEKPIVLPFDAEVGELHIEIAAETV